jgi:hypothetical protein
MKSSYSRSPLSGIKNQGPGTSQDVIGVLSALESVCELESRLRLAIKCTHPTSLDSARDAVSADRERKALLNLGYVVCSRRRAGCSSVADGRVEANKFEISLDDVRDVGHDRQQLEDLEDKLRELRFVSQDKASQADVDDQKSVLLGQLDAVRRELVEAAYAAADKVVYGKELLKDIINFALADEEENRLVTPGRGARGRYSVENTPKGKRTPAVPDSLENTYGRVSTRLSPGSSAGRSDRSGRPPRPESNTSSRRGTPTSATGVDEQRKYSSFSRTLMVSDEDIYGPKAGAERFGVGSDSQKYGGTVKVKELLAKAERGLTEVSSAQKGRRATESGETGATANAPRVIHEDANYNGEAWMDQELGDEFDSSHTQYATPGAEKQRKAFSSTPTSQRAGREGENDRAAMNGSKFGKFDSGTSRRIDYGRKTYSAGGGGGGGLLGAISKLAGLAVVAGGLAAGAVLVSQSAKSGGVMPKASPSKKKGSRKKIRSASSNARKGKGTPAYRGEADVYMADLYSDGLDDTVYFEEHNADGPQSPVVNVHRPPASTHFPAASPDVSVAMG